VLKTQLHSNKLSQLKHHDWQDCEDILTGDFFGAIDYLPRQPYLHDFLRSVELLNEKNGRFELDRVDWDEVEMLFWPHGPGHDDLTEPDVVLVSNRWIIVVEVKLNSGLGDSQPWREYQFGQQFAEDRGLAGNAVHYVILSRETLTRTKTFAGLESKRRVELESRTLWIRWSDVLSLVDGWLRRRGEGAWQAAKNNIRMLEDLHRAIRRRRTLSFCGFGFPQQRDVHRPSPPTFCPPLFKGFLRKTSARCDLQCSGGFFTTFKGFCYETCASKATSMEFVWLRRFEGFVQSMERAKAPSESIFCSDVFRGWVSNAPVCVVSTTLGLHKKDMARK
jgi:hypothetical protein